MKLVVFVSHVGVEITQWHHYAMRILPTFVEDGKRYHEPIIVMPPVHPAIRRLEAHEHRVDQLLFCTRFDEAIRVHDPNAAALVVLVVHNMPDLYETQTLKLINGIRGEYPELNVKDITVVPVAEGMPVTRVAHTFTEFTHTMHEDDE